MPAPEDRDGRSNGKNNGFPVVKIAWPDLGPSTLAGSSYWRDFTLLAPNVRERARVHGTEANRITE